MKFLPVVTLILTFFAASSTARADDIAEAREHFRKGSKAFDLGHYQEAIKEYEAAYNLKEDPALLFNIAQAYRLEGDNQNAIRVYKSFLHHLPNAPNRADVERRIDELQKAIDQQRRANEGPPEGTLPPGADRPVAPPSSSPAEATPPVGAVPAAAVTTTAPVDRPGRGKKIAGLVVAGVGVAAIAVGGAFAAMAVKAGDDLTKLDQTMGTFDSSKQSAGKNDQIAGAVCFGIGGAAIVAGVVLYVLGHRESRRAPANASAFHVVPRLAGAGAAVTF